MARLSAVALAMVGVAVLTACGSGGGSAGPSTPSGTATRVTSEVATARPAVAKTAALGADGLPVDLPGAARVNTDPGAVEFVRYYFNAVNAAWTGPVVGLVPSLGAPGSRACALVEETVVEMVAKGTRYGSAPSRVLSLTALPEASAEVRQVRAVVESLPAPYVDSKDARLGIGETGRFSYLVRLSWTGQGFRLIDSTASAP